jgi:hypothetical protein
MSVSTSGQASRGVTQVDLGKGLPVRVTPANMQLIVEASMRPFLGIVCLCLIGWSLPAAAAEKRCGWYGNPAPGDMLLTDRDGDWWITGGGEGADAKGLDNVPQMSDRGFIATGVPGSGRGFNCACLTVETNARTQRITRVISGQILPLTQCRNDRSLPSPS